MLRGHCHHLDAIVLLKVWLAQNILSKCGTRRRVNVVGIVLGRSVQYSE